MANAKFEVVFDVESIVKVECLVEECRFNMYRWVRVNDMACALKHIRIRPDGKCADMELKQAHEQPN